MRKGVLTVLTFALCLALAGTAAAKNLTIGTLSPITGSYAADGNDIVKGAKTAVALFKDSGGMPGYDGIEVVTEDDACDPRQAVAGANKLVSMKVAAVVGSYCSSATIPASEVLAEADIPMITPASTNPKVTERGLKYMFRMCGIDAHQSKAGVDFMVKELKAKTVYVLDDKTTYSQHLAEFVAEAAAKEGVKVLAHEHVNEGDMDYSAVLTKIKQANPDVFYMSLQNSSTGIRMIKQIRQLGLTCKILSQDAVFHPNFIKEANAEAQGVYFTFGWVDPSTENYKKYIEKYKALFGEPGAYSAYAFDATWVMLGAMKAANSTDPAKVRAEIMKINAPGASKNIKFQENGDSGSNYVIYEVKGDKFAPIYDPATGKKM
jgi:branched-chain amino acid transport system substrate-binding protein